ncbi:MAG: hypothetical protein R6V45_04120 [Oceanipulchritudo sp.]
MLMRILVANFDAQTVVTKEEVIEAVITLPPTHISGIHVIRYDPLRTIATTLGYLSEQPSVVSSQGLFYHDREAAVIVLFKFRDRREFLHVLYHEIGHYVFLRRLDQGQRDRWMYHIRKVETGTVSAYAKRNSREDFAETYAVFCTGGPGLDQLPLRMAFMREAVFG